ncbi:MAG: isoleucine--tRNA ligase [Gemmatimonadota bacterium]
MSYRELPETVGALEEEIERLWEEEDTFHRSLREREGAAEFVFYEGPPTANGRPGVHHIISRTLKDLIARFRTMTGHHVTRIAGWDAHGLPVEIEAEKQLGISGKPEIEALGIGEFNRVCRDNIFTYQDDWVRLSRRIGYWLDYEHPYVTCSPDYVESVWWALARIEERGLLYRGYRIVPYCWRCGTGLSSHEVALGYRDVSEPSVTVKFHLRDDPDGARVLSWTTTPWTLPGNLALAVGEDLDYVRVRVLEPPAGESAPPGADPGEVLILARERAEAVLRHPFEVLEEIRGRDLLGLPYEPLFPGAVDAPREPPNWTILPAEFVTVDEGTGVVHTAVMYGEDDFELGARAGLPMRHTVREDGRFVESVPGGLAGLHVKDEATELRIRDYLEERDLLYRRDRYEHSYPHCWRCDSALLYMARDSWYVRTTAVKDRLLELNASVDWHPPEIGTGRMGEWLANNVDWALSRERYWGTPLPIWECDETAEHRVVIGSYAELARRAGPLPEDFDPHRPGIDRLEWKCGRPGCSGTLRRVAQVADAWFDSGSMPYAQWHYPFENETEFERHFPADYIAEGVDQTRGWFYSLLALSALLFDRAPYRAVVVNDLVLDAAGHKMSKSRGNTVEPWEAIREHGADAIRFYLVSSSHPWLPKRWDPAGLREVDRKLFSTLRNTYRFFAMYANLEGWTHRDPGARPWEERSLLDRWLLSRLDSLTAAVTEDLRRYEVTPPARRIAAFVLDDLSNWYVRRSRDRYWATRPEQADSADTADAFATLHEALRTCSRLLAPFAPFLPDWLHRELSDGRSVHLEDYPEDLGRRDPELEREMEDVRQLVGLGRAAREDAGLRVRQPLRTLRVVVPGGRSLSPALVEILRQELNVRRVVFLQDSDEIVRLFVKPVFAALGPRLGARTPAVAAAIAALGHEEAARLQRGETVTVTADGREVTVRPDEVTVVEEAESELAVRSGAGFLVALDRTVDDELRAEGIARELVNRVQRLRRDAGFHVADRIRLGIAGGAGVEAAATAHRDYIAGETLAVEVVVGDGSTSGFPHTEEIRIEDLRATIGVERSQGSGAAGRPAGSAPGSAEESETH